MGWSALRAKIKTKLDSLVTAGTLGYVFNGEQNPQNIEVPAYPAAMIIREQSEPEFFTNREDLQGYMFTIHLLMPLTADNWDTQEIAMDTVMDAVVQVFLDDASLGGTADGRVQPIPMQAGQVSWNGIMHRRDTIVLKCRKITAMAG